MLKVLLGEKLPDSVCADEDDDEADDDEPHIQSQMVLKVLKKVI